MGKVSPKCVEGRTKEDRVRIRKRPGSLKQIAAQPATRVRYDRALKGFFSGEGRALGSDTLAAIQDAQPQVRGKLQQSWRLMKTRVSNELPNRAPPLSEDILHALVGLALFRKDPLFALSLLLGFYSMLRTGGHFGCDEIPCFSRSRVYSGRRFARAYQSRQEARCGRKCHRVCRRCSSSAVTMEGIHSDSC